MGAATNIEEMPGQVIIVPSTLHRALEPVCKGFALVGGSILMVLINVSLVSIVGRKLFSAPVRGDMELMEMGMAVAIATFLPLCELQGMHIKADAFTLKAPQQVNRCLDALAHALLAVVACVLTWRTYLQMCDYKEYGDVSTLLSVPMWIPLLLILPSLVLLALCALARLNDLVAYKKVSP